MPVAEEYFKTQLCVQPELIEQYIMNKTKVDRALVTRSKNDKLVCILSWETKQTEVFTALIIFRTSDNIVDFVKCVPKIETNHLNKVIRHQFKKSFSVQDIPTIKNASIGTKEVL